MTRPRCERRAAAMHRAVVCAGAVFLISALLLAGCSGAAPATDSATAPEPATDFSLPALNGGEIALSDLRGQVVLVNFWTTWCPACREEMPLLEVAYRERAASGFVVLAVDMEESRETVGQFIRGNGYTYPVVLDQDGEVSRAYNVYYIPHSVIIDRDGMVRRVKVGAFTSKDDILNAVTPYLSN